MEVIWEALDDALHEVLLRQVVLAREDLLHHTGQNDLLHTARHLPGITRRGVHNTRYYRSDYQHIGDIYVFFMVSACQSWYTVALYSW